MKKIFNLFTAIALAVAASISLTACGDDDDEFQGGNDLQTIYWTITGDITGDVDAIFDYDASIVLPEGTKKSLSSISATNPGKLTGMVNANTVNLPAEFTMIVERKVKSAYTPAAGAKATWSESFVLTINLVNDANYSIAEKQTGFNDEKIGVNLADWLSKFGDSTQSVSIKVKKSQNSYTLE